MKQRLYIIVPVHNRRQITERFVRCLKQQTHDNYHLILVDDGSVDGTEAMVREHITALTVIKGNGRWWWAGSLQRGYEWLKRSDAQKTDIVLIINDDTEFESDFLEKGCRILAQHEQSLLLAHCYSRYTSQLIGSGIAVDWKHFSFKRAETPDEINCLSTKGLFLTVESLFDVGGFHHKLLPHYASDYEFTMRASRRGKKLITDVELKLVADEKTTGCHRFEPDTLESTYRKIFSRKSVQNPVMWTAFILLSCPLRYWALNITRVWANAASLLISGYLNEMSVDGKTRPPSRLRSLLAAAAVFLKKTIEHRKLLWKLGKREATSPLRVVLGAGGTTANGWIPTDIDNLNILSVGDWNKYFAEGSIDVIMAEHVWEHLRCEDGQVAASHCYKYLKAGGSLRAAVPDGYHPNSRYIDYVKVGGVGPGARDHKELYNYKSFTKIFERAGFKVKLLEYFDETGKFVSTDWEPASGMIRRSCKYDDYTSIIVDAMKV